MHFFANKNYNNKNIHVFRLKKNAFRDSLGALNNGHAFSLTIQTRQFSEEKTAPGPHMLTHAVTHMSFMLKTQGEYFQF